MLSLIHFLMMITVSLAAGGFIAIMIDPSVAYVYHNFFANLLR